MSELEVQHPGLLNPQTGELLPANVDSAAEVLQACRQVREHLHDLVGETTAFLVTEAERLGKKTLHGEAETITLSGGPGDEYDPVDLMELLASAGCPEQRINEAVTTEITYKVNRNVLKQLAVNGDYKAAIELARRTVEKPYRASVKARRNNG